MGRIKVERAAVRAADERPARPRRRRAPFFAGLPTIMPESACFARVGGISTRRPESARECPCSGPLRPDRSAVAVPTARHLHLPGSAWDAPCMRGPWTAPVGAGSEKFGGLGVSAGLFKVSFAIPRGGRRLAGFPSVRSGLGSEVKYHPHARRLLQTRTKQGGGCTARRWPVTCGVDHWRRRGSKSPSL